MSDAKAVTEVVRAFYERFHFPGVRPPDRDGLILMRRLSRLEERVEAHERSAIRVLDAGCGTGNTLVGCARALPAVEFVGVDISASSLEKAREAAVGLNNVEFVQGDILCPGFEPRSFDAVVCLGVLHHLADMTQGLLALSELLVDSGELYLWVYGRHGRYFHSLNVRLLRMLLDVRPCVDPVPLTREFTRSVQDGAPITALYGVGAPGNRDWRCSDAWLADQFLHPHESTLDMDELLTLANRAGLKLGEWLGVRADIQSHISASRLIERFHRLSERQKRVALDLLLKPSHYFVLLQPVDR